MTRRGLLEQGMLEKKDGVAPKAPGLQAPPRKRAAEPEHGGVAAAEKEEYQEHWFGPAAAIKVPALTAET